MEDEGVFGEIIWKWLSCCVPNKITPPLKGTSERRISKGTTDTVLPIFFCTVLIMWLRRLLNLLGKMTQKCTPFLALTHSGKPFKGIRTLGLAHRRTEHSIVILFGDVCRNYTPSFSSCKYLLLRTLQVLHKELCQDAALLVARKFNCICNYTLQSRIFRMIHLSRWLYV